MTAALITDMSQPLATAAGNALEVIEVMETLTGTSVNAALWDLTAALGGEALALGGPGRRSRGWRGPDRRRRCKAGGGRDVRAHGRGAGRACRFRRTLARPAALGPGACARCRASRDGFVTAIDGEALGQAVVHLGGGRLRDGDRVNPSVGLADLAGIGEEIGRRAAAGHGPCRDRGRCGRGGRARCRRPIAMGDTAPDEPPLIHARIA